MSWISQYNGSCGNCNRGYPHVDMVVPVVYDKGGRVHSSGYLCIDCLRNELYKNKEDKPQQQKNQQPKSITMAEDLKKKEFLQKKAKLGDGSNIAAEDR
jgi:hypothetical protein